MPELRPLILLALFPPVNEGLYLAKYTGDADDWMILGEKTLRSYCDGVHLAFQCELVDKGLFMDSNSKKSAMGSRPWPECLAWILGALILPSALILFGHIFKHEAFRAEFATGELLLIACTLIGSACGVELLLRSGGTTMNKLSRLAIMIILFADVLGYAGVVLTTKKSEISDFAIVWSMTLLGLSALFGLITTWGVESEKGRGPAKAWELK